MRTPWIIAAALSLAFAAGAARADHDRDLGYLVGGALLGAALADLAHDRRHAEDRYRYRDARHRHGHGHGHRQWRRTRHHARHFHAGPYAMRRHWRHAPHLHVHGVYYR